MGLEQLITMGPIALALCASLFTWFMTALGAALVFFFKDINQKVLNGMLGFASGVMIAASFFSLLAPAVDMAEELNMTAWIVVAIGFLAGGVFLWISDHTIPHMHFQDKTHHEEGIHTKLKRSILLVFSITLHNIPEGLAVGVAFGALAQHASVPELMAAFTVALGIGIQNFPEGAAVSIPLRKEGLSRTKSFLYGQASGLVEPISAVIGAFLVTAVRPILPYALAFAAGAMIYVVTEELIPESQTGGHEATHFSTMGCIVGFVIMMILDVAFG